MENEILVVLLVVDLDVGVFGVYAKREVGGKGPGCGCPCKERGFAIVDEGEGDGD